MDQRTEIEEPSLVYLTLSKTRLWCYLSMLLIGMFIASIIAYNAALGDVVAFGWYLVSGLVLVTYIIFQVVTNLEVKRTKLHLNDYQESHEQPDSLNSRVH